MRRLMAAAAVFLSVGVVATGSGLALSFESAHPVPPGSDLEVSLKVGEMEVETGDVDEVRVELSAACGPQSVEKCEKRLDRLQVESIFNEAGTAIKVAGVSKRYTRSVLADANIGDAEIYTSFGEPDPSRTLLSRNTEPYFRSKARVWVTRRAPRPLRLSFNRDDLSGGLCGRPTGGR